MPRRRALIAALIALLLLAIGLALALFGATVPAGKEHAVPVESAEADRVTAGSDAAPATDSQTIPANYQGEWTRDLAACGTGDAESRLRIGPRLVRFYESEGRVAAVRSAAPRSLAVTLEMRGEGAQWRETRTLALSPDGDALTDGGLNRRRCP